MTSDDDQRHRANLAWATALDTALLTVARRRGVSPTGVPDEDQCEISAALAAGLAALASEDDLPWDDLLLIVAAELDAVRRVRPVAHA